MPTCQWFTLSPGDAQGLTSWMGFHASMSMIHIEPRRCTGTHILDGISCQHVSGSNWAQEVHSDSPTGWDFMPACQLFTLSPGDTWLPPVSHVQKSLFHWFYSHLLSLCHCWINKSSNDITVIHTYYTCMLTFIPKMWLWYLHPKIYYHHAQWLVQKQILTWSLLTSVLTSENIFNMITYHIIAMYKPWYRLEYH